jgi:hypothetical protein
MLIFYFLLDQSYLNGLYAQTETVTTGFTIYVDNTIPKRKKKHGGERSKCSWPCLAAMEEN